MDESVTLLPPLRLPRLPELVPPLTLRQSSTLVRENHETSTSCGRAEWFCQCTPPREAPGSRRCSSRAVLCVPEPPVPVMKSAPVHSTRATPHLARHASSRLPWKSLRWHAAPQRLSTAVLALARLLYESVYLVRVEEAVPVG